jgi:hypothetical protein
MMGNQSIIVFTGLLLIIIFTLSANLISGIIFPEKSVIAPQTIQEPVKIQPPPIIVSHIFPFEKAMVSLSVSINASVLEEIQKEGKISSFFYNNSGSVGVADRYRAMVTDPVQEQVFYHLLEELRTVRRIQGLSDDEYLELMAVYVQSLRYESVERSPVKFPAETIFDSAGDCDDKSLLLAGLLAREGYSVALLSFGPEAHMAIGIGSDDYLYKKTGYAFLETTNYSFVGVPTDSLGSNLTLSSDPVIIVISTGKKLYSSGNNTRYIHESYVKSEQKMKELASELTDFNNDIMAKRKRIGELESQIAQLKNSGQIKEYNSQVATYSTLVSIYNRRLSSVRQIYTDYYKYTDIHNYIFEHKYDRKGVYDYVKKNLSF